MQVVVNVENLGAVPLYNVPIDLTDSRNGGPAAGVGQMVIPELDPGATVAETFTLSALGGDHVYVGSIDAAAAAYDSNLTDNAAQATLTVPGLPSLSATATVSAGTTAIGGPLTLTATLTNAGLADAANVPLVVTAALAAGGPSYVVGTAVVTVTGLGTASVSIPLTTAGLSPGNYTLTLRVDPAQTIVQSTATPATAAVAETLTGPVTLSAAAEYLRLDADGQTLDIWNAMTPTGSPARQVAVAAISSLTVAAAGGSESVTADFANGDPLPASGLTFTGPAGGTNVLALLGTAGNDAVTVGGSTVTFAAAFGSVALAYSNLTAITFNGGTGGADSLTQAAQPGGGAGLTFVAPTATDTLTVNAGRYTFLAPAAGSGVTPVTLAAVTVAAGAVVAASPPNGSANRVLFVLGSLAVARGTGGAFLGQFDLSANDLVVRGGNLAAVTSAAAAGYAAGTFAGPGLASSAAAGDARRLHALGVAANNDGTGARLYGAGTARGLFDGYDPALSDVLVRYTYFGDANLDGKVDGQDYARVDAGYAARGSATPLTGWFNGDFNDDGTADGSDYTLIDNAFNEQAAPGTPSAAAAVPAPARATVDHRLSAGPLWSTTPITILPDRATSGDASPALAFADDLVEDGRRRHGRLGSHGV